MGARPILVSDRPIVFFDANCLLCSRFIKTMLKYDRGALFFSSFETTIANEILPKNQISEPTTIVYSSQGELLYKSKAVFALLNQMAWPWKFLNIFKVLPTKWGDGIYDLIARNRISWFGRSDTCFLPTPHQSARFLE